MLLAAGLDMRAYRLLWPRDVRVFELDLLEMMGRFRESPHLLLDLSRCKRAVVPVDFRKDWAVPLIKAALSTGEPTVWLAEGLLTYRAHESQRTC